MLAGLWSDRNSHSLPVGMQDGAATLKSSLAVSSQTKYTLLPWNPTITLLGIEQKNLKFYNYAKVCTRMFIATYSQLQKLSSHQDVVQ